MTRRTAVVGKHDIARGYKSVIWVETKTYRANAKSILSIMAAGVLSEIKITIVADGVDEKEAVEALTRFIEDNSA